MRALPLALACLLVVAGCSGLAPGGSAPGTQTETLTPVPYSPSPTPVPYPNGLAPSGAVTGFDLASTHVEALENTSYTVVEMRAIHYENGSVVQNISERARIGADRRRYRFGFGGTEGFSGPGTHTQEVVLASNGTLVAEKRVRDGGDPHYSLAVTPGGDRVAPRNLYHGTPLNRDRLIRLYEVGDLSVTRTDDGFRLALPEPVRVDGELFGPPVAHVTVTSLTFSLTPEGRVHSYRLAFEAEFRGEPVTGVERVTYSGVGTTTVTMPTWFDETVNESR